MTRLPVIFLSFIAAWSNLSRAASSWEDAIVQQVAEQCKEPVSLSFANNKLWMIKRLDETAASTPTKQSDWQYAFLQFGGVPVFENRSVEMAFLGGDLSEQTASGLAKHFSPSILERIGVALNCLVDICATISNPCGMNGSANDCSVEHEANRLTTWNVHVGLNGQFPVEVKYKRGGKQQSLHLRFFGKANAPKLVGWISQPGQPGLVGLVGVRIKHDELLLPDFLSKTVQQDLASMNQEYFTPYHLD